MQRQRISICPIPNRQVRLYVTNYTLYRYRGAHDRRRSGGDQYAETNYPNARLGRIIVSLAVGTLIIRW